MCFLSSGFARVNKEIKSLTCENLRISAPPRSAERQQEEENEGRRRRKRREPCSDGRPGSLLAAHPQVPSPAALAWSLTLLPSPISEPVRINKIININNSFAKANRQCIITVLPSPRPRTAALSGNVDSDPSIALSLPHPPSPYRSSPRSPNRPHRQAETRRGGAGSVLEAAGGKPWGTHGRVVREGHVCGLRAHTHTRAHTSGLTHTSAPKEAAKRERRWRKNGS